MNYLLDGYYEYNFNQPTGRANNLRAYDVLSNVFSINQADFIFDLDPDVAAHRSMVFASTCNSVRPRRHCKETPRTSHVRRFIAISSKRTAPMWFRLAMA